MVEYQLPKLATGVRFPSLAPFQSPSILLISSFIFLSLISGCATAPKKEVFVEKPRIPGALYHKVSRGETLWSISKRYGVDMQSIIKANSILYSGAIENGQVLLIPRSGIVSRPESIRPILGESFMWPIRGTVISPYGSITDKIINKGIDIKTSEGAGIRASRSGRVVYSDNFLKGFGKTVIIDHGDSYQTVYSYNSDILVKVGDQVAQNTVIARAGKTGRAATTSLHFEIRRDGEPQNPYYYLPH